MNTETLEIKIIEPEIIDVKPVTELEDFTKSLRLLADFYEANPDMFLPDKVIKIYSTSSKEDLIKVAKIFKTFKKSYTDDFIYLTKSFGSIDLQVAEYRQKTCERVVLGTRKVIKEVPVEMKSVEVEEEIVEWRCKETSLLGANVINQIEGQ